MTFPKMRVSDPVKMGKLIRKWAETSPPETLADFKQQTASAGITVTFEGYPTADGQPDDLVIHPHPPMNVLYLSLPEIAAIKAAEDDLLAMVDHAEKARASGQGGEDLGAYPLPDFYADAMPGGTPRTYWSREDILDFCMARLAEYTTTKCQ